MGKKAIFLFRRDLRLHDNTALLKALQQYDEVVPVFVFTPEQVSLQNPYRSSNAIQFMMESLQEVDQELRLQKSKNFCFYGSTLKIVQKLIEDYKPGALYVNEDYTPYARLRDKALKE